MRRTLTGILAAVVLAVSSAAVCAASDSSVEVKNDSNTVKYNYEAGSKKEAVSSVTKLFNNTADLSKKKSEVTQVITLKSNTGNGDVMHFTLRMSDNKDYADEEISAEDSVLTYYNVSITDSEGKLISETVADAEDIEENEDGIYIKNLDLGQINTHFTTDTKVYNVTVSVPEALSQAQITEAEENIEWELVCIPEKLFVYDSAEIAEAISATAEPESTPNIPEAVTHTPAATALAATPEPEKEAKGIKYVGEDKDIVPGRYTITGNGLVKVYNSDNELKTNILLTDSEKDSDGGISSYVLTFKDGDRLEISDYVNLKPYSAAKATESPKATTKATTAPKTAVKATTAPSATVKPSSKTNPKTGDTAPVAAVSVIAILALGACVYIEISKRKKN